MLDMAYNKNGFALSHPFSYNGVKKDQGGGVM